MAIDYVHHPHPQTEKRKLTAPPKIADQHVGFNGRLGAAITRSVGTDKALDGMIRRFEQLEKRMAG